ncbi:DUF4158 domain-containing protein [Kitasatospora xanthocidica]|uniref:DUF4158 domain-containing protein n=1 Tax=Kitasatospora xanthocidica TaxID=83382 RepID=UPI003571458A
MANKAGPTRLGFCLVLKFFELEGRFPEVVEETPQQAVEYVAELVKVPAADFVKYSLTGRTPTPPPACATGSPPANASPAPPPGAPSPQPPMSLASKATSPPAPSSTRPAPTSPATASSCSTTPTRC